MNRFKELRVWQKSVDLAVEIYKFTNQLPSIEKFGLVTQMNRAVVSIASNIAEGAGRNNPGEFIQFLGIANGSSFELETQLNICLKIKYIDEQTFQKLEIELIEIQKMIFNLQKTLKK